LSFRNTEFQAGAVAAMLKAAAAVAVAAAAAEPAFARLQVLSFEGCREGKLMQYRSPLIDSYAYGPSGCVYDFAYKTHALFKAVPCSSLSLLTGSFPNLRRLSIVDSLWPDGSIAALLALRSLSSLCVDDSGDVITDAAVSSVLAGMTGLRELMLGGCSKLTQKGLLGLTQLRRLTHLAVRGMSWSSREVELRSQVSCVSAVMIVV
jgi:hypothetical protein